jgi:formylmethanofuran dehydrogenase subunit A
VLPSLEREYTLNEIAIITRASPARLLGLKDKGQLGVGADADITLYSPHPTWKQTFELPRMVLKAGEIVCENGEFRHIPFGLLHAVNPSFDDGWLPHFRNWFQDNYSIQFDNFAVDDSYLQEGVVLQSC